MHLEPKRARDWTLLAISFLKLIQEMYVLAGLLLNYPHRERLA